MKQFNLSAFFILAFLCAVQGQTWKKLSKKEIKMWNQKIESNLNHSDMVMTYTIKSFLDYHTEVPSDIEIGQSKSIQGNTWSKVHNIETLQEDSLTIVIDHNNQMVYLKRIERDSENVFNSKWMNQILDYTKIEILETDSTKTLRFSYPNGLDAVATDLLFDLNFKLIKSTIYLSTGIENTSESNIGIETRPRIEVQFNTIEVMVGLSESDWNILKKVKVEKEGVWLDDSLKNYTIVDSRY